MKKYAICALFALSVSACADDGANRSSLVDPTPSMDAGSDLATIPDASGETDMAEDASLDVSDLNDAEEDMAADLSQRDTAPDMETPTIAERCFGDVGHGFGPDYDQFNPNVGEHCLGTNHQYIWGVEKVVFLGDSVTVGTPPALPRRWYRTLLAESLATKFNLAAPDIAWRAADPFSGKASKIESGDFKSCSKWGARTDDFLKGGNQIAECFPDGG